MKCWFRRRWIKMDFLSPFTFVSSLYFSMCLSPTRAPLTVPSYHSLPWMLGSILLTVFHGTSIFLPCSLVVCVPLWSPLLDYQPSQKQSLQLLHFLGLLSLLTTACGMRLDEPMDGCKLSDVGSFIWGLLSLSEYKMALSHLLIFLRLLGEAILNPYSANAAMKGPINSNCSGSFRVLALLY